MQMSKQSIAQLATARYMLRLDLYTEVRLTTRVPYMTLD